MRAALLFSILIKEGKMLSHKVMAILVAASLVCMSGLQTSAADISKSLVGTWRVTSFSMTTLETNEVSRSYGENPIGYL
jgi:hypothetical protein